jgi:hypothetical protein
VTLAAGDTVTGYAGYATTPGPITVHPTPGEVVTVRLWDIAPAGQSLHAVGSYGGVAVGVEDRP